MSSRIPPTRIPRYRALGTFLKTPLENEDFSTLMSLLKENRQDGIVILEIGDREVCALRIENGRIYLNEMVDETVSELDVLREFPVYDKIALKSMVAKYLEALTGDLIEDNGFLNSVKNERDKITENGIEFILDVWGRFWNVRTRFNGDSKDGIYILNERDVYSESDDNTFISK
ncbi:MAG: hypothetical protein M1526_05420 [Candidatus Thermoplasmatota archaeon]|jgi:hypothetical protein|nr:hypothetical protein [Candidatus Thermoplasmatota archaeon]MCL5681261.1 hypothetical protein [Candidatus Thermoplasmatota archaeon]